MRLNMHIIFDELRNFAPIRNFHQEYRATKPMNIKKAELFAQTKSLKEDVLYITNEETFFFKNELKSKQSLHFILLRNNQTNTFEETERDLWNNSPYQIIFIDQKYSIQDFFNTVISIFEKYNEWELEIKNAIIEKLSLQKFLDICTKMLSNPCYMFDSFYNAIYLSNTVTKDTPHIEKTAIKYFLDSMFFSYDEPINDIKDHGSDYFITLPNAYWEPASEASYPFISVNLFNGKERFGELNMSELFAPLTSGQLYLLEFIRIQLTLYLNNTQNNLFTQNSPTLILKKMISNESVSETLLSNILKTKGWKNTDSYYVLIFRNAKDEPSQNYYNLIHGQIRKILPQSLYTLHNEEIICIAKLESPLYHTIKKLECHLQKSNMKVSYSVQFYCFTELRRYYQQASFALNFGEKTAPEKISYSYRDYYFEHIIQYLKDVDYRLFCDPKIFLLKEYDKKKHTELFFTLLKYLENNLNLNETARALFVHRNTITYRIHKVEEILQIDLKESHETKHLYFSCKLAEYHENNA